MRRTLPLASLLLLAPLACCSRRGAARPVAAPPAPLALPAQAPPRERGASADPADPVEQPLGRLAAHSPAAARVLHAHGIDFCCGGGTTLAAAARQRGLDPRRLASEIEAAQREASADEQVRWDARPPAELMAHVVRRYHGSLRSELPRLIGLARTVDRVHAGRPDLPAGLSDHLVALTDDLLRHLDDEERGVFPRIEAGAARRGDADVEALRADHEALARALGRTRALTGGLKAPADACATWQALYGGLLRLELDLMTHAHLENNVLLAALPG